MANLPSGNFRVDVVSGLAANLTQTHDLNGLLDDSALRTLGIGEAATDVDFGYEGAASIGDTVWYDADGDSTQNNDEPGIAGAAVTLYDLARDTRMNHQLEVASGVMADEAARLLKEFFRKKRG